MVANNKSSDTYALNESLQTLLKGTGLMFIGILVMIFFGFIGNALIARTWAVSDLGIFSLACSVLSIFINISTLGLTKGIIRSIAYSIGKKERKKIPDLIVTSIFFSVTTSIVIGLILALFSEVIAINIFNETRLIYPLKLLAISLPFYIFNNNIVAIFRGFELIKPTVYFHYFLESILFPVFIAGIVIFQLPFINVFYAYVSVRIIVSIGLIIYTFKKAPSLKTLSIRSVVSPVAKELIFFSLPLLGTAMLQLIITHTDKLMLGGYKTAVEVGYYSIAASLALLITFPLSALIVIYVPVFSRLYAEGLLDEIKRNYIIITKWFCAATFPIFLMLFLFSESTITVLFGPKYVPGANVLRLLSLAYLISVLAGPNGATLIGLGKSRFVMLATLTTTIINISLNALLIPSYGIMGAAVATGISIVFNNIIRNWKIYSISKIQPLSKNLVKPALVALILIYPIYLYSQQYLTTDWWSLLLLFILFYGIYIISVLLTNSLDKEDIEMLLTIEAKTGIKLTRIRMFMTKFL